MTLQVQNISVGYGGAPVIDGVTFDARRSALTALIGANGAGKSTLLKAVAGLAAGQGQGQVLVDGAIADRKAVVAYMPQDTSAASGLTMLETVMLGKLRSLGWSTPPDVVREAALLLERFGIAALSDRPLDAVSGGQRQLAFLAQALLRGPEVLLLDEPTAALDLRHQLLVLETVTAYARERNIVVVAAMHDLSLVARFARDVICLHQGRIASAGDVATVLTESRIREVYGVHARVADTPQGVSVTLLRTI